MASIQEENISRFRMRLQTTVQDLFTVKGTHPHWISSPRRALMDAHNPDEMACMILAHVPLGLQVVLGEQDEIGIDDLLALTDVVACKPDKEPGVYLGIATGDHALPALYGGKSGHENGTLYRTAAHSSRARRAGEPNKLWYVYIDDPQAPLDPKFLLFARFPRGSVEFQTWGDSILLFTEQLLINMFGLTDVNDERPPFIRLPSCECLSLPEFRPSNRYQPILETGPSDVLTLEEIRKRVSERTKRYREGSKGKAYAASARYKALDRENAQRKRDRNAVARAAGDPRAVASYQRHQANVQASSKKLYKERKALREQGDPVEIARWEDKLARGRANNAKYQAQKKAEELQKAAEGNRKITDFFS